MVRRRGEQAGVRVHPHRFRRHFSHTPGLTGVALRRSDGAERLTSHIMDDAPLPEPAEGRRTRHPIQAKYPPICTPGEAQVPASGVAPEWLIWQCVAVPGLAAVLQGEATASHAASRSRVAGRP